MTLQLYAHPFSSYCQKVLIALYENDTPFTFRMLAPGEDATLAEFVQRWPLQRMPVLVDRERTVFESSVVIEYLGLYHPGPVRLIPQDPDTALEVRKMDRVFDNYIMTPMQAIVFDYIRPKDGRDAHGVHPRHVDHHACLADGVARHIVAAGADSDGKPVLAGEGDGRRHVSGIVRPKDQSGTPVDHAVPDDARGLIGRVRAVQNLAAKDGPQSVDGACLNCRNGSVRHGPLLLLRTD